MPLLPASILGTAAASSASPVYVSPLSSSAPSIGSTITLAQNPKSALFYLNFNQSPPNSSQTINVYIEHSPDGGVTFDDFVSFPLVAGKGTPADQIAVWVRDVAPSSSAIVRTPTTRTLAAGTVLQGPVAPVWRCEAVPATSCSSSQAWQINVTAQIGQ